MSGKKIADSLHAGVLFKQARLTQDNYESMLGELVGPGDIIVDLSWNVETFDMLQLVRRASMSATSTRRSRSGIRTATSRTSRPYERSLYSRQMRIRLLKDRLNSRRQAEPDGDHRSRREPRPRQPLHQASAARNRHDDDRKRAAGGHRRRQRGVREAGRRRREPGRRIVAPDSARPPAPRSSISPSATPRCPRDRRPSTSSSTRGQSKAFTRKAPRLPNWDGGRTSGSLPKNAIRRSEVLAIRSSSLSLAFGRSSIPGCPAGGPIIGMVVRHAESFTISDHLTVWDNTIEGWRAVYRPTVHYAYMPCDNAILSLLRTDDAEFPASAEAQNHVRRDQRVAWTSSACCLMGHGLNGLVDRLAARHSRSAPAGPRPERDDAPGGRGSARRLGVHDSATPRKAFSCPTSCPTVRFSTSPDPYLGPCPSVQTNWTPLESRSRLFAKWGTPPVSESDLWQFASFAVEP